MVIEATYGWYWAVDLLQDLGATVHLANPNALNWGDRRVKNDVNDATDLADMLRLNRLAEAWIAPPAIAGAAGAGALSSQARPAAQRSQGAGPCGDGQRGCAPQGDRHVRSGGQPSARSARTWRTVRDRGSVRCGS